MMTRKKIKAKVSCCSAACCCCAGCLSLCMCCRLQPVGAAPLPPYRRQQVTGVDNEADFNVWYMGDTDTYCEVKPEKVP